MDENMTEVQFFKYCDNCKHAKKHGYEDPCNECLDFPARYGAEKPLHYEKAE